jgi:hypothetical protein
MDPIVSPIQSAVPIHGASVLGRVRAKELHNPLRTAVFYCGVVLVFIRFSMLHQFVTYVTGLNLYLLYIFGIPVLIGVVVTGGLRRMLRHRTARYWMLFGAWMIIALPFSTWKGGSAGIVAGYWRTELIMLFAIGGLVETWRECRLMLYSIGAAAVVDIISSRLFGRLDDGGRFFMAVGTVANANDFAAHLLFLLPFLLWIVQSARSSLLRLIALAGIFAGIYLILSTGSRGGTVALAIEIAFAILAAAPRHRVQIFVAAAFILLVAIMIVPERAFQRALSFSDNRSLSSEEAIESRDSRKYLLEQSVIYTLANPLFGVGPGQFSIYEGNQSQAEGKHGSWHETHNSFTKASSECGIPALIFFVGAIFTTFRLLGMMRRQVQGSSGMEDVATAVFCMRLGMIGFCTAIVFLNFTYSFYLPAMTGLAIAICNAIEQRRQAAICSDGKAAI